MIPPTNVDPTTLFALDNLKIERRNNELWIEGQDGPLTTDNARITYTTLRSDDSDGYCIAMGTREQLATMNAPIKLVTEGAVFQAVKDELAGRR